MAIDLSQFHQVFYEESFEGLEVMESNLMELDPNNIDAETINAIFRTAHSIKGGSATFGFKAISEFTHDLETILDQVRSGERQFTSQDVDLCLKSVDCMRELLQLLQQGQDGKTPLSKELSERFAGMLNTPVAGEADSPTPVDIENQHEEAAKTWRISFVPHEDILRTGNDVTRMLRELSELGEFRDIVCSAALPEFSAMDPESCFLSWQITLQSKKERLYIEEVFEWVADESLVDLEEVASEKTMHWQISFIPGESILRTGNEPVRLFNALSELGEISVQAKIDKLPSLASLEHESCYFYWEIQLHSQTADEKVIRDIFEWVADEAELTISQVKTLSVESTPENASVAETPITSAEIAEAQPAAVLAVDPEPIKAAPVTGKNAISKPVATKKAAESGSIRVGIDKVDNLINMVGELVITQSMLGQLGTEFDLDRVPKLMEGLVQLEQNTRELQESVMRIRMLPISFAFSRFPRMVRDLGQNLGKEIRLEMLGEQTELDKTVMEKIGDPLVHLVRNAVDHGIESPNEREAKGKPRAGTITLNAYHQGGNVVIEIGDNGKGLDKPVIVEKAVQKGLVTEAEAAIFSDEQAFDLIFQPGFSTAKAVSDVSGRGVGMDVVKRNIQALNGSVEIRSEKDIGSKITIRLPLTLAILDGQLVRVGTNTYIFPLVSIVESLQCRKDRISRVAGGCDVFKLRGDYVPIIELHKTFSVAPDSDDLDQSLLVVVECDGEKVGVVVDELLAQQQVVIKSLEQNYHRVDGVSGATILGDGTVALIIDIIGVVKLAGEKFAVSQQQMRSLEARSVHTQLAS